MTLKIHDDLEKARRTVLQRRDMMNLDEVPEPVQAGIARVFGEELTPEQAVARLLADVRNRGDEALREWTVRIDGLTLGDLEVSAPEWQAAYERLPADLTEALKLSAGRIRDFHARQPIPCWTTDTLGGQLGQKLVPLERFTSNGRRTSEKSASSIRYQPCRPIQAKLPPKPYKPLKYGGKNWIKLPVKSPCVSRSRYT